MRVFGICLPSNDSNIEWDGIDYEGKLWLVPFWLDIPALGQTMPGRMVRIDDLPHGIDGEGSYVLGVRIPEALLNQTPLMETVTGYEVRELPELRFIRESKSQ